MQKYAMIQPRYGRYGISGWDVMVVGMELILCRTKALARKWCKENGYDVLVGC